jgi:multimeric flavodoxin WrbA
MKVIAFNGSPRGRGSQTGKIVEALFRGMNRAGVETEQVFLSEHKIAPCSGCFACWFQTPGACIHQDDMPRLLEKLTDSDLVIYATPLYVDNVTGIMKNFMDRCIPRVHPHFITDATGERRHPRRQEKSEGKLMVVSCCGFIEISQFQALEHLFQRTARNQSVTVIGRIFRTTGELLKGNIEEVKPLVDRYFSLVEKAGEALVEQGAIPTDLQAQLDAPLVDGKLYIEAHNRFCDSMVGPLK